MWGGRDEGEIEKGRGLRWRLGWRWSEGEDGVRVYMG